MNYVYIWLLALAGTNILAQQAEKVITDTIASKSRSTLSQALAEATAFAINSDGTFAIAAHGRQVTFLNLDPQDPQSRPFPTQESEAWQVFLSKTGKKAVFHNPTEPAVVLWTIDGQNMQSHPFPEQSFWPEEILISSDENSVTTLKKGVEPMLWDISNPHNIQRSSFQEQIGKIRTISEDGTYIVTGKPGALLLWNMGEQKPQSSLLPKQLTQKHKIFAISPNRELAIIKTLEDGDIKLWNLNDGTSHALPGTGTILAAAFTTDSSVMISRHIRSPYDGRSSVRLLNCIDPQNIKTVFTNWYGIAVTKITLFQDLKCALLTCLNAFVDLLLLETRERSEVVSDVQSDASLAASPSTN